MNAVENDASDIYEQIQLTAHAEPQAPTTQEEPRPWGKA